MAEGFPFAPLLFLLLAKELIRLIRYDANLGCIKIGTRVHKQTPFADDSIIFLAGMSNVGNFYYLVLPPLVCMAF